MRPNLITRLKEEWAQLDPVDPLRGLISDAIEALAEQPAQIPDAFDRIMREADKPTQIPEQLAKYVAALVNGTHEITSVTIRPKREWVGLTNQELIDLTSAHSGAALYCAIEAKLKEKNYG